MAQLHGERDRAAVRHGPRLRASNPDAAAKRVRVSTGSGYPVALNIPPTGSFGTYALALSAPFWLPAGATAIRLDFAGPSG